MPKVSVLTPIYNTNPVHLREMIESILSQTFTDFEFLILNDSPDNQEIENMVFEYVKNDKRIKYYKNERNLGITPSRNKLLKLATGEYLAIFDHDDISLPTRLEQEVAYLDAHPYVGVVSGWLQYFGDKNFVLKTPEIDSVIKIKLTTGCYIMHTAAMIRKTVLVANDIEYEECYTPAEDYRLWKKLMSVTQFHNIQDVLVKYRWHEANTTKNQHTKLADEWYKVQQEIANKYPISYLEYNRFYNVGTQFRLRLFGFIPLLKIKNNKIYLFECLPVLKIKWR